MELSLHVKTLDHCRALNLKGYSSHQSEGPLNLKRQNLKRLYVHCSSRYRIELTPRRKGRAQFEGRLFSGP